MGFDSWSLRDKVVMVWGLVIATVALVFVGVSLGNVLSDNSANIASWVQAIGALIMVGISVSIFVIGENRRNEEKKEERDLLIDEAKFYLLRHGSAFLGIYTYAFSSQLIFYRPENRGRGNTLFHFPAVSLFIHMIPQIQQLHAEFQEFMQMQVPMGVPKLCVGHIHQHYSIVTLINNILDSNKLNVEKIRTLEKSRNTAYEQPELSILEEMEDHLSLYVPHLIKLNNELKIAHEKMLKEIFNR